MNEGLRTFPVRDRAFAREVERVLENVSWRSDEAAVQAATDELRRTYPNALLRWRDAMGGYAHSVCYAFRDGRVRPEEPIRERLYDALARSRAVTRDSKRIMAASGRVGGADGDTGER